MKKVLIFSREVFLDYYNKEEIKGFLNNEENIIVFTSGKEFVIKEMEQLFQNFKSKIYVKSRDKLKEIMKKKPEEINRYIIIGNRDMDFQTAVNNKLLYIVPMWCKDVNDNSKKYGVKIHTLTQLKEIIKTVNNQHNWYYHEVLDDIAEVYSLTSGNSKIGGVSKNEKELVDGFRAFLKEGKVDYYEILFYHFLAGMTNNDVFRNVDIWGIAPSSGVNLSKEMMFFKDRARYLMKKKFTKEGENLILRYFKIEQSKNLNGYVREKEGAGRLLDSIYLNPNYNVKGKTICIFDDYLDYGNTFEAIRNILKFAGAKKVIFVSLGKFRKDYIYQEYEIKGDVKAPGMFTFKEINRRKFVYICNNKAREEVENLHNIFNL